jgi:hypothetical protein
MLNRSNAIEYKEFVQSSMGLATLSNEFHDYFSSLFEDLRSSVGLCSKASARRDRGDATSKERSAHD